MNKMNGKDKININMNIVEVRIVRDIVKKYMDKGYSKFVIYPYTDNGIIVKNVLKEYFCMAPVMIVDNDLYHYNKNIISFDEFIRNYTDSIIVILTTFDKKLNENLKHLLFQHIPSQNVINLYHLQLIKRGVEITNQFDMSYLFNKSENTLPASDVKYAKNEILTKKAEKTKKIKVRFIHASSATWNAIYTICSEFEKDSLFDLKIIMCPLSERGKNQMEYQLKNTSFNHMMYSEYSIKEDLPDILVVSHPCAEVPESLRNARLYTKMIVVASIALISYGENLQEVFWKDSEKSGYKLFSPDYLLFDSYLYHKIKKNNFFSGKLVEMGNAKYDGIYNKTREKRLPQEWKKLEGKHIVLWSTDHGINNIHIGNDVTFDVYAEFIFEYARQHSEIAFVFRPHSTFILELLKYGFWTEDDITGIKKYMAKSENMVWDEFDTYDNAYSVSDAILVDGYCGMIMSALPLLKPICCMFRYEESQPIDKEIVACHYQAHNTEELELFLNQVAEGRDGLYDKRKDSIGKFVKHFDGKNGLRIKEYIKKEFLDNYQ